MSERVVEARIRPIDLIEYPCIFHELFISQAIRQQGIKFDSAGILRPYRWWSELDGTLVVQQKESAQ